MNLPYPWAVGRPSLLGLAASGVTPAETILPGTGVSTEVTEVGDQKAGTEAGLSTALKEAEKYEMYYEENGKDGDEEGVENIPPAESNEVNNAELTIDEAEHDTVKGDDGFDVDKLVDYLEQDDGVINQNDGASVSPQQAQEAAKDAFVAANLAAEAVQQAGNIVDDVEREEVTLEFAEGTQDVPDDADRGETEEVGQEREGERDEDYYQEDEGMSRSCF